MKYKKIKNIKLSSKFNELRSKLEKSTRNSKSAGRRVPTHYSAKLPIKTPSSQPTKVNNSVIKSEKVKPFEIASAQLSPKSVTRNMNETSAVRINFSNTSLSPFHSERGKLSPIKTMCVFKSEDEWKECTQNLTLKSDAEVLQTTISRIKLDRLVFLI